MRRQTSVTEKASFAFKKALWSGTKSGRAFGWERWENVWKFSMGKWQLCSTCFGVRVPKKGREYFRIIQAFINLVSAHTLTHSRTYIAHDLLCWAREEDDETCFAVPSPQIKNIHFSMTQKDRKWNSSDLHGCFSFALMAIERGGKISVSSCSEIKPGPFMCPVASRTSGLGLLETQYEWRQKAMSDEGRELGTRSDMVQWFSTM